MNFSNEFTFLSKKKKPTHEYIYFDDSRALRQTHYLIVMTIQYMCIIFIHTHKDIIFLRHISVIVFEK